MSGKVLLFIVEGPSDKDAIMPFITAELARQKIKTTVKIIHGDILTKYIDGIKKYEVTPENVKGKIKEIVSTYLESPPIKADQIKLKHISKLYYLTDTDNCFFKNEVHSVNKRNCLIKMFNFGKIEMNKLKIIPFEVIFFSNNLEHVIDNNQKTLTDKEKEEIAYDFAVNSLLDSNYFINTFTDSTLKTWETYRESYDGIKVYEGRACNMNNLLDEMEKWMVLGAVKIDL